MATVIAYKNEKTGGVVIVTPAPQCSLTLEQIAQKDVPPNVPYVFIDEANLPDAWEFFDAWEIDITEPHGHGANFGYGSYYAVTGYNPDGSPILREEKDIQ